MARHIIKKMFPGMERMRGHKALAPLGPRLGSPDLWHLNRRSVAGAFAVGLFVTFLPLPMQMLIAAAVAIIVRVNLPISVILVWISNPITMPPMLYTAYTIGRKLLDEPRRDIRLDWSWEWFSTELLTIWQPLLLGSVLLGSVASLSGYLLVRFLWRLNVVQRVRSRRYLRRLRKELAEREAAERSEEEKSNKKQPPLG
ncbi:MULTISPECIES: DUF2062 domain-containing protein [unclassified Thioalkalivibrio]|uniref:DUF2062 domain-containing protein n=1 Tax=unclassified Thioalkalivibrio TaxID=2621013 RepID=UPI0003614B65|nr:MULTISPECIES: DUF2062 domain-containing protein [unclassified Thioalkalivibrio]